jgi:hypothetical protein
VSPDLPPPPVQGALAWATLGVALVRDVVGAVAWPVTLVIVLRMFRPQAAGLLGRIRNLKLLGTEIEAAGPPIEEIGTVRAQEAPPPS